MMATVANKALMVQGIYIGGSFLITGYLDIWIFGYLEIDVCVKKQYWYKYFFLFISMTDFGSSFQSVTIPTASLMVKYAPTVRCALYQFFTNFGVFFLSIGWLYLFRNNGFFIGMPFLTLSMVRTFIILHDCGHSSFSPSRRLNWWIGTFHGILLCMPFSWSSHHYIHHLVSGNKSNGNRWSETVQFSVEEYEALPRFSKQMYRRLREPWFFFSCLPSF